ncbi:hypothetical protein JCM11251_005234 [Rhodosporidiobolus azoricus]
MLDISMFATDFLAASTHSRLSLLVDDLALERKKLGTLTSSLLSCISAYSLSLPETSTWMEEDSADQVEDDALLPRLFQLSIALRGPVYEAVLADTATDGTTTHETPGKKRQAFIQWCYTRNPLLKPKEGAPSPSGAIRRAKQSKISWPPPAHSAMDDTGIGLGLPKALYAGSPPSRRAASQPALSAADSPSSPPLPLPSIGPLPQLLRADSEPAPKAAELAQPRLLSASASSLSPVSSEADPAADVANGSSPNLMPSRLVDGSPSSDNEAGALVESPSVEHDGQEGEDKLPGEASEDERSSPPIDVVNFIPTNEVGDAAPPPPAAAVSFTPSEAALPPQFPRVLPVESLLKPDFHNTASGSGHDDPLLSIGRRDSAASSVAMTVTASAGSRLFEGVGEEGQQDAIVSGCGGKYAYAGEVGGKEKVKREAEEVEVDGEVDKKVKSEQEIQPQSPGVDGAAIAGEETEDPRLELQGKEEDGEGPGMATAHTNDLAANPSAHPVVSVSPTTVKPIIVVAAKDVAESPSHCVALPVDSSAATKVQEVSLSVATPVGASPPVPVVAVEESVLKAVSPITVCPPPPPAISPPLPPPVSCLSALTIRPATRPFRILALDGCGVVGPIPQLVLLEHYVPASSSASQHFDLIVGTSASALVAIFIGHLGFSVDEALAVWRRIAQEAFALVLPPSSGGAVRAKPRRGVWSRLFGRGVGSSVPPQIETVDESTRRAQALDKAIKTFLPQADQHFSGGACRVALLAFERNEGGSRGTWLSNQGDGAEHGLTVGEVLKASLAASPFFPATPCWTRSPASLNPSASALSLVRTSAATPSRPISLLSLSSGYSSLSLDASALKRLGKTRLSALREVKQLAASNAVAAAALAKKVEGEEGVEVERLEVDARGMGFWTERNGRRLKLSGLQSAGRWEEWADQSRPFGSRARQER